MTVSLGSTEEEIDDDGRPLDITAASGTSAAVSGRQPIVSPHAGASDKSAFEFLAVPATGSAVDTDEKVASATVPDPAPTVEDSARPASTTGWLYRQMVSLNKALRNFMIPRIDYTLWMTYVAVAS